VSLAAPAAPPPPPSLPLPPCSFLRPSHTDLGVQAVLLHCKDDEAAPHRHAHVRGRLLHRGRQLHPHALQGVPHRFRSGPQEVNLGAGRIEGETEDDCGFGYIKPLGLEGTDLNSAPSGTCLWPPKPDQSIKPLLVLPHGTFGLDRANKLYNHECRPTLTSTGIASLSPCAFVWSPLAAFCIFVAQGPVGASNGHLLKKTV
jgi:hypothetical protein